MASFFKCCPVKKSEASSPENVFLFDNRDPVHCGCSSSMSIQLAVFLTRGGAFGFSLREGRRSRAAPSMREWGGGMCAAPSRDAPASSSACVSTLPLCPLHISCVHSTLRRGHERERSKPCVSQTQSLLKRCYDRQLGRM